MSNTFYNEILIEHNLHPTHKHELPDANLVLEGVNPSCGDDIWLKLKIENEENVDGAFVGDGCELSQASAEMKLDLIIVTAKGDELEPLEEASILQDVSHMPARVKCAVLGWHTMEEMFKKAAEGKIIPGMSVTTENK